MRARARVKRNDQVGAFDTIKDIITTLFLHLSFYAFIISLVIFFMDYFS